MPAKYLVFDLGGVLIEVASARRIAALLGLSLPQAEALWVRSHWLARFETGRCSQQEFAANIVQELQLPLSPDEFSREFPLFCSGFYPGARELLETLTKKGHALACLSDTNSLQWESLCQRLGLDRYFSRAVLSYRVGECKPHPAMYQAALKALACKPEELLYFDDRPGNVQAAQGLGIPSFQVEGPGQLGQRLRELGYLDRLQK